MSHHTLNTLLLTLLAALLLTACDEEGDEKDVTAMFNLTWNANESLTRHTDGTITYDAIAWGGLVLYQAEEHIDWSRYGKIVFEFAQPTTVDTQVFLNDRARAWGSPGITSLECSLEGDDAGIVTQLALQAAEPTVLTIARIYLSIESTPNTTTAIWEGNCVFGSWNNGLAIGPERFDNAVEGDRLEIVYTTDDSDPNVDYWQFKTVINSIEKTLTGNAADLNEWGCATMAKGTTKYTITLTADDVAELQAHGLFIGGYYIVVSQCNLLQAGSEEDLF